MAEGDTPSAAELAAAIEKLDTVIAKQKELLKLRQQDAEILGDFNEELRIQAGLREKELTILSTKFDKAKSIEEVEKMLTFEMRERIYNLEIEAQKVFDISEKREVALGLIAKERAQQELIKQTVNQTEKAVGGIAGKLGIATKFSETAVGQFADMALNLAQSGKGSEIMSSALATTLGPANLLASLFEKIVESVVATALQLDSAESALQRSTGFAVNFRDSMLDVAAANVMSGVTIADTQASFGALVSNFSAFSPTAAEANKSLLETTTLLEKVGVTSEVSTKQIDFFVRALGMTTAGAQELTVEIALAAQSIGISAAKMTSDFAAVSSNLSVYGDQMVDVFLDLEAQAKATGIEVSQLVKIGEQFNTFDKAAEITGKLNAVLGTNLSSMQMINLTEAERVKLLRQELRATVGNFDSLDKYTQMYIQQAAGLSSVAEARRLVNANEQEYLAHNAAMQERAATQQELKEATESFVPVVEALQIAVLNLAMEFKPLISGLTFLLDNVMQPLISNFLEITGILVGASIGFKLLTLAQQGYTLSQMAGLGVLYLQQAATTALSAVRGILTIVTGGLTLAQIGLNTATAIGAARILLLATVLFFLYRAFTKRGSPPLYLMGFTMAAGIIALGIAVKVGGNKLLIFTGLLAVLFLAVHLIIESVAGLVSVVSEMFQMFIDNAAILPQLAVSLYLVGGAFLFFAASVAAGATMLAAAAPFLLLAAIALAPITAEVTMLGKAFQLIGSGMEQIVAGLNAISAFKSDDEFFAIQTSGEGTTMVSAKGGILKNFSSDKLSVEVKIPEINMPTPVVKVFIGDEELRNIVRTEMSRV